MGAIISEKENCENTCSVKIITTIKISKFDFMAKKTAHSDPKVLNAKLNPLVDYKAQIAVNKKRKGKTIGETSFNDDPRNELYKVPSDKMIYYRDDMGNFEHAKVIVEPVTNRNTIMSLELSSLKLLFWILFQLEYRCETVNINPIEAKRKGLKMALGSIRNSVEELCRKRILKRVNETPKSIDFWNFFINPQIIWKGDAKKFYKDILNVHPEFLSANSDL